jgi:RNA polymerase sigma-70 factor (ECF subfamily)
MNVQDAGLDAFLDERPRLLGLAYRMTGSRRDAEDVVQEAYLRWSSTDPAAIENPAGWLTTVATRLCIDRTRLLARRREDYVGSWLPEPVQTSRSTEETVELAESLTLGFLTVLDRLGPLERAVFLLHEVFGTPFAEIADAVGRTETACRQIASRARHKVHDRDGPVEPADDDLVARLLTALLAGDTTAVVDLLAPDVVVLADAGPSRHAARRPVVGPDRAARLLVNLVKRLGPEIAPSFVSLNGQLTTYVTDGQGPIITGFGASHGRVSRIWILLNPDKLSGVDEPFDGW